MEALHYLYRQTPEERFLDRVYCDPNTGCWLWLGSLGEQGYGRFSDARVRDGPMSAAEAAWRIFRGPMPAGLQPDHLCRIRGCASPYHLEPVTQRVNLLRANGVSARAARRTHCVNGHEYDAANTYRDPDGYRHCRRCNVESVRRHGQRYRAGLGPAPDLQERVRALELENAELRARLALYDQP